MSEFHRITTVSFCVTEMGAQNISWVPEQHKDYFWNATSWLVRRNVAICDVANDSLEVDRSWEGRIATNVFMLRSCYLWNGGTNNS